MILRCLDQFWAFFPGLHCHNLPPAHLDALVRGDEAGAVLAGLAPALLLVAGRALPRPRPRGLAGLVAALAGAGLWPQPSHARLLCTAAILLHIGIIGSGNSVTRP